MNERVNNTDDDDDDDVLPIGVESLSDYTPYKLHLLLTIPLPSDIPTSKESSSIDNDNSLDSPLDEPPLCEQPLDKSPSEKSKKSSKKRNFFRYFLPINRPQTPSIQCERDKSYQKQLSIQSIDDCDMRFFIIRHAERVDRYFGSNWYKLAFDHNDQYRPYHRNFPPSLPLRSNNYFWALDTPLTLVGLTSSEKLGKILQSKQFQPSYVYSSPAMRCMLTTIHILRGLKLKNKIPIRIEPGLLELGAARFGMEIFFKPKDWHKYGINIDLSYQPIISHIPSIEREDTYYLRSKYVIREIEKRHKNSSNELLNIFLIAHATSPETLTWDLIGKQPNVNDLYKLSLEITYLQTVITEHKQDDKFWSLKPMKWI
jgi:broad specificity phosphatase PhoE